MQAFYDVNSEPNSYQLFNQLMGHAVIVAIGFDMIIYMHASIEKLCKLIGRRNSKAIGETSFYGNISH